MGKLSKKTLYKCISEGLMHVVYTAFQRAIDEVRTLPLSLPKDGSKSELFLFWNKSQLQLNEVCYKVSLRENLQRQSCSTLIPLYNGT